MRWLELDVRPGAGRPILLAVLVAASLAVTTLWYREGPTGPLHQTRGVALAVSTPIYEAGAFVTSPLRAIGAYVGDLAISRTDYETLKAQNQQLKATVAGLEEARQENLRLSALVGFAGAQDYKTVGARVIGRPSESLDRSIVIDRGSSSEVTAGAPVIAAGGLLGQVTTVEPWSSKVRLITAPDSGVAVIIQRTRVLGVVKGSVDGHLWLDFVPKNKRPKVGDVLMTSGLGQLYPKGVVVGEVSSITTQPADLYLRIGVVSRVPIDNIEEVLVRIGAPPTTLNTGGGE